MNRRSFLGSAIGAGLTAVASPANGAQARTNRPNIVLILAEISAMAI
jgi:hypothetical protein